MSDDKFDCEIMGWEFFYSLSEEVARKIIAIAEENGVVIESNPHLVEALSGVDLDETIPIELYQAVAEVIGFVLRAQNKVK